MNFFEGVFEGTSLKILPSNFRIFGYIRPLPKGPFGVIGVRLGPIILKDHFISKP